MACAQDAATALGLAPLADEGAVMSMSGLTNDALRSINYNETWATRLARAEVAQLLLTFPLPSVYSVAEDRVTEYIAGVALLLQPCVSLWGVQRACIHNLCVFES